MRRFAAWGVRDTECLFRKALPEILKNSVPSLISIKNQPEALTFQNVWQAALVMSQRSQLPLKIMDKLETLVNLVEMLEL